VTNLNNFCFADFILFIGCYS